MFDNVQLYCILLHVEHKMNIQLDNKDNGKYGDLQDSEDGDTYVDSLNDMIYFEEDEYDHHGHTTRSLEICFDNLKTKYHSLDC